MSDAWLKFIENVRIIKILIFNESRKVSFGLWFFLVSTYLLIDTKITSEQYMTFTFLVTALVGGGTIADKFIDAKKGKQNVPTVDDTEKH